MTFEPYELTRTDKNGARVVLCGRSIGSRTGMPIVMIASLGRPGSDFDEVATALATGGYRVTLPDPRGIAGSAGPMIDLTLHDLAEDVAAVVESLGSAPVTMLGHAFGNRLARTMAADFPSLVSRVILLACGGLIEMPHEARTALIKCFSDDLAPDEHLKNVAYGFFAKGNDASVWRGGWHAPVMAMQSTAVRLTPVEDWWEAGGQPMLVVQALEDTIALPANAYDIQKRMPDRVTLVELPNAGHAMLPEQPARIIEIVRNYLGA